MRALVLAAFLLTSCHHPTLMGAECERLLKSLCVADCHALFVWLRDQGRFEEYRDREGDCIAQTC